MSDVTTSGPVFDGGAESLARDGAMDCRHRLADRGAELTRLAFSSSIRVDAGRFLHSVTSTEVTRTFVTQGSGKAYMLPVVVEDSATDIVVTTDLATYGPWLEGTGSRNESTRFKGYHGFRRAWEQLTREAPQLVADTLVPFVRAMQ